MSWLDPRSLMCEKSMQKRQASIPEKIGQSMRLIDQLLRGAIRNKRLIEFEYQQLKRVAEPHDYGIQNGIKKVLVYQVSGGSKSGRLPDWRDCDRLHGAGARIGRKISWKPSQVRL